MHKFLRKKVVIFEWEIDIVIILVLFLGILLGTYIALSGITAHLFADSADSVTQTTDTHFSQGSLSNVVVSGSGDSGSLSLAGSAGPDNTLYRRKLTFDNLGQAENLTNFPVLISLNSANFDFSKAQGDGDDVRFTDSDGTTQLDYEIESYDSISETASIWVKVPQIDQNSNSDFIYMYYGNDTLSTTQSASGVWESDYAMVYHFAEANGTTGADSVLDSTGNTAGTPTSGISFGQSGKIGSSVNLSSGTGISLGSLGSPLLPIGETISFWFNINNYSSPSRQNPFDQAYGGWGTMTLETNSRISWYFGSNGGNASPYGGYQSNNMAENGNWVHVTAVRDPSTHTYSWYKDGAYLNGSSYTASYPVINTRTFTIGDGYVNPFNGRIDEFRISNQVRSADWISATYLSDTNTFVSYGSEETTLQTFGTWSSPTNSNVINLTWNGGWGDGINDASTAFTADISNASASSSITFKIRTASSPAALNTASYQILGTAVSSPLLSPKVI